MNNPWTRLGRPLRTLLGAALVVAAGAAAGVALNGRFLLAGLPPPRAVTENDIDLPQAKNLFDAGQTIFLDAREADDYAKGHLLGALSLPAEEFEKVFPTLDQRIPRDRSIVTYCGGADCELSRVLAEKLREQGYDHVKVFFGGWPQWLSAGYPTAQGAP